jgi:protein-disulfide isomerase
MLRSILPLLTVVTLAVASATSPTQAQAPAFWDSQRGAIDQMIRDYILAHPEIIVESIRQMDEREKAAQAERQRQALGDIRDAMESDPGSHVIGNPDGDVTLVEFFDYQCSYCKRFLPVLQKVLAADSNVRVILKEFPILGPDSIVASRAALAARMQAPDRYPAFHDALMANRGPLPESRLFDIAARIGLDVDRLKRDMEHPEIGQTIARNYAHAEAIGVRGTPGFVIGDRIVPGYIDEQRVLELVSDARRNCKAC